MGRYAVLIGQIEQELKSLGQLVSQTDSLMQKIKATGDIDLSADLEEFTQFLRAINGV